MKVSELYAQVAQLGFEDSLDNDKRFLFALSRALYQANGIRPHTSCVDVVHFPPQNLLDCTHVRAHTSDSVLVDTGSYSVEASGGAIAYYFEVLGVGRLSVYVDGAMVFYVDFDSRLTTKAYKGLIPNPDKKNVKLTFGSDNMMCLKSIALYAGLFANDETAIPDSTSYYRYDLSEIAEDFLSFALPPFIQDEREAPLYEGYDVEGNSLLLFVDIPGIYRVTYQRKLRLPDGAKKPSVNDETIDLDEELCSAIPLLVASYVWLEDEPERAAYYKNLYNERVAEIMQNKRDFKVTKIINTNGW